jgi:hypothetical protein
MSDIKGMPVKGGAATTISSDGDIRMVIHLDKSWLVSLFLFSSNVHQLTE